MTNWSVKAIKQVAEVRLGKMVQPSPTSDLQVASAGYPCRGSGRSGGRGFAPSTSRTASGSTIL